MSKANARLGDCAFDARPKEELGIDLADHIRNVVWHEHKGQLLLVCQSWNPGYYPVFDLTGYR
jgi:hypothetical protein